MNARLKAARDNWLDLPRDDDRVTVCGHCLRASCWQGKFMCESSRVAGTLDITVGELKSMDLENPSYWII